MMEKTKEIDPGINSIYFAPCRSNRLPEIRLVMYWRNIWIEPIHAISEAVF